MANKTLTPEVMKVLRGSTITDNQLVLPAGRLDRPLYQAVDMALRNAGGKWSTRAQAHVFDGDPRPKLGLMLETGVAVDEKKQFQAFYTPPDVAQVVVALADVKGRVVLEPSAGHGALADACMASGARSVRCIEIQPESAAKLKAKGYPNVCGDFLTHHPTREYERIVMNPPFSRDQDIRHIAHALTWLSTGGLLVSVVLGGKDRPKLKRALEGYDWQIRDLGEGAFKSSGTNVKTSVLTCTRKPLEL